MKKKWLAAVAAAAVAGAGIGMLTACSKENKEEEHTHTYSTAWSKDDTRHWFAATCEHGEYTIAKADHAWDNGTEITAATEETEGSIKYTCVVCKAEKTESIDILGHTYSSDWKADTENHWHVATCGHSTEKSGEAAHSFGEWETVTAATHTDKGVEKRVCSVCNYTATRETDTTGEHTYNESTWSFDNNKHWLSSTCGHADEREYEGFHDYTTENPYVVADSSKTPEQGKYDLNGYHLKRCYNCNYILYETHNLVTTFYRECDCTQEGIVRSECACGYKQETIYPMEHRYTSVWSCDETQHWKDILCDAHKDKTAEERLEIVKNTDGITKYQYGLHDWDEGEVVNEGILYTCKICKTTKTEEVTFVDSFDVVMATAVSGAGTPTSSAISVKLENDETYFISSPMYFCFDDIQPAGATISSEYELGLVKVYEVFTDGTDPVELSNETNTVGYYSAANKCVVIRLPDGNEHRIRIATKNVTKEFTVRTGLITSISGTASLDGGETWNTYLNGRRPNPATFEVGTEILFTASQAGYTYAITNGDETKCTITRHEDIAGQNEVCTFTASAAGNYTITVYGQYEDIKGEILIKVTEATA